MSILANPKDIKAVGNNEVEKYFSLYNQYKELYENKGKFTIYFQQGDFYEIYGLEYIDKDSDSCNDSGDDSDDDSDDENEELLNKQNKRVGSLWELSKDIGISIGVKKVTMYNNPNIKVFIGGVGIRFIDKYLSLSIESDWTVIIYNQQYIKSSDSYIRVFDRIVNKNMYLNSNKDTNITMVICLEKVKSIINPNNDHVLYAGISLIDTLTGFVGVSQYPKKEQLYDTVIYDEITKLITIKNPSKIIIYADKCNISKNDLVKKLHLEIYDYDIIFDEFPKKYTKINYQESLFKNIYEYKLKKSKENTKNIFETLDINNEIYIRYSLMVLFEYVIKHNQSILNRLDKPKLMYNECSNLILQNNSLEQLSIVNNIKSNHHYEQNRIPLLTLLDKTVTAIGKRGFRNKLMNPIIDINKLNTSYDNIENFMKLDTNKQNRIRNILMKISDLNKILRRVTNYTFKYNEVTNLLYSLKQCIKLSNKLKKYDLNYLNVNHKKQEQLTNLIKYLEQNFNIEYLNDNNIYSYEVIGNIFNKKINKKLDTIQDDIDLNNNIIDIIIKKLNIMIDSEYYLKKKDKNGTKSLINKCSNVKLNTYITTTSNRKSLIKEKIEKSEKKHGYAMMIGKLKIRKKDFNFELYNKSSYRIDLECIRNSGFNLITLKSKLQEETKKHFNTILDTIYEKYNKIIKKYIKYIEDIDIIQSSATIANENGYIKPTIDETTTDSYIDVKDLRHPIIEYIHTDVQYIPNDIILGKDKQNGCLLFSVNAAGKSSLMKSLGILIIMAQSGMYVPASSFSYHPYKYILTRICSNDNMYAGMSTFTIEMSEIYSILKYGNKASLILCDEPCKGTTPEDAISIVVSFIDRLSKLNASFLIATHLHYLSSCKHITKLDNVHCKHLSISFDKISGDLIYNRKLTDGSGPSTYGIEVCKSLRFEDEFMDLALQVREEITNKNKMIMGKQSKYNKEKYLHNCEICKENLAVDTHHIKFQCTADKNTGKIDYWDKDSRFNLVSLCKECHQSVHSSPPRLKINGFITTNKGIQLDYKVLDDKKMTSKQLEKKKETKLDDNIILLIKKYKDRLTAKQIQNKIFKDKEIKLTQKNIKNTIKQLTN